MDIKLIVSDLDGTLLNMERELSRRSVEAVSLLKEKGYRFTVCSGRNLGGILRAVNGLPLEEALISSGGAMITDIQSKTIIARQALAEDKVRRLLEYARQMNLAIMLHKPLGVVIEERKNTVDGKSSSRRQRTINGPSDLQALDTDEVIKVNFFREDGEYTRVRRMIQKEFPSLGFCLVEGHLEVLPKNINKGNALVRLSEHLKIPLESILVIGDDANDISMFKVAGYSVAMGNAIPEVKAVADEICLSNAEDGAAVFFENLAMGRFQPKT